MSLATTFVSLRIFTKNRYLYFPLAPFLNGLASYSYSAAFAAMVASLMFLVLLVPIGLLVVYPLAFDTRLLLYVVSFPFVCFGACCAAGAFLFSYIAIPSLDAKRALRQMEQC